jgi:hypothetical protein
MIKHLAFSEVEMAINGGDNTPTQKPEFVANPGEN